MKPFAYSWLNNLIRLVLVNLAWFLLGEAGLLLAGSGLVVEFALFQRRRHLKLKAERLARQQLAEHALVESTRFNVTDRGK